MTTALPYQFLPDLTADEFAALRADIASNGYDPAHPVVVDEADNILDGHHRVRACAELGIEYPTAVREDLDERGKHEYALQTNLARRHLSSAQKRELIGRLLHADPSRSDRAIGRLVGCDHKTVAAVRRGEIPQWPEHPWLAWLPPLSRAEQQSLIESIRTHGLLKPITTHEGVILDGRARLAACRTAGVEPRFEEYTGDHPGAFVVAMNLYRQHLSPEQMAGVRADLDSQQPERAARLRGDDQ